MNTIPLTQGQAAVVDDSEFERLSLWKWQASRKATGFYVFRNIELARVGGKRRRLRIYLHRYLMGFPNGDLFDVHHKNHQPLDNRRENLQIVSVKLHVRWRRKAPARDGHPTSSRYIGVSWWKSEQKWVTQLQKSGARIFFGRFDSEFEAALAFDAQSRIANGNEAMLNFQVR